MQCCFDLLVQDSMRPGKLTGVLQDSLRDSPLVELTLPILFVHGSKDTMCEPDTFQAVRDRMSSYDVQVYCLHRCFALQKKVTHLTSLSETQAHLRVWVARCTKLKVVTMD